MNTQTTPPQESVKVSPRSGVAPPIQTPTIRAKISASKTRFSKETLIAGCKSYLQRITEQPSEAKAVPTIAGLALEIGCSKQTLFEKAEFIPEVAATIETITNLQEDMALSGGLTNRTNPVFSIFLLKSKHGYLDQPQQLVQNNTFSIPPDLLADALKLMKNSK